MSRTNMVLVMGAQFEADQQQWRRDAQDLLNVRLCFPKLLDKGRSIMHSKLMLLFYESYMRIVVPTANLVPYDWGETGVMENTVFLIDLPRRGDGAQAKEEDLTLFGKSLYAFLGNMGMQENVMKGVLNFDYENTKEIGFVYTA
jgi:Tyrosyl-DNA phosphodiesterase